MKGVSKTFYSIQGMVTSFTVHIKTISKVNMFGENDHRVRGEGPRDFLNSLVQVTQLSPDVPFMDVSVEWGDQANG